MLKIESYVGPIIESTLSKFIEIQPNTLKISLWSGQCKLKNLNLKLSTIEHELNLPFKLLSGSINEISVNIPWTSLGSQSIVISCSSLELTCELKETQKAELKDQLPEDSDDEFMDANSESFSQFSEAEDEFENSAIGSTRNRQSTGSKKSNSNAIINDVGPENPNQELTEQDASYLENLINKIRYNIKIEINGVVFKYQEAEFVVRANIQKLILTAADEFWQATFFESFSNNNSNSSNKSNTNLNSQEINIRQLCRVENLTMNIDSRNPVTGEIDESFPDPFLSKTQLEIRIFNCFKSIKSLNKPYLVKADFLFEKVNIAMADRQLPIAIRISNLITALYYREFTWDQTENPMSGTFSRTNSYNLNSEQSAENTWASWAMSMFAGPEKNSGSNSENSDEPAMIILCGLYFRKFSIWLKTRDNPQIQATGFSQKSSMAGGSEPVNPTFEAETTDYSSNNNANNSTPISYSPVFNFDIEGVGIEISMKSNLQFYNCVAGVTHIQGRYCGGLKEYPLPMNSNQILFLNLGVSVRKKNTWHYLSGSLFDYMSPENNSSSSEYYLDVESHEKYWTDEFINKRFGAFFSDYIYTTFDQDELKNQENSSQRELQILKAANINPLNSDLLDVHNWRILGENSKKVLKIGPGMINLNSLTIGAIIVSAQWAMEHKFRPYVIHEEMVPKEDEFRREPSLEQMNWVWVWE